MKIIIEGEPKEIAAYELALKDGETLSISKINCKLANQLRDSANQLSCDFRTPAKL